MRRITILSFLCMAALQLALALSPHSGARAAENLILTGDEQLENWVSEMQAEILFDVHLERALSLGDRAMKRADEIWGPQSDSNVYSHQYVLFHTLLATLNLTRADSHRSREALMNGLVSAMEGKAILLNADKLSESEEHIVETLLNVTRARIECRFSGDRQKNRAYKDTIKSLKKIDAEDMNSGVTLMSAYVDDGKKYDGLSSDQEYALVLANDIAILTLEQIQAEGFVARMEGERDFCRSTYQGFN